MSGTLDTIGPMTTTVEDFAWLYQALHGFDNSDKSTYWRKENDVIQGLGAGVKGLTLAYAGGCLIEDADSEAMESLHGSPEIFRNLGANVIDLTVSEFQEVKDMEMRFAISATEVYTVLKNTPYVNMDKLDPVSRWISVGKEISASRYVEILRWQEKISSRVMESMANVDALISPTTLIPAVPISEIDPADGDGTEDYSHGPCELFTRNASIGNMLGLCGISLPCGFTASGLPLGMQIYGKAFSEDMILRIAHAYQMATHWHKSKPDLGWIK